MASILIARKHNLTHKQAKDVAEAIAKDLNKRFDLDYTWDGDDIEFERAGVHGTMRVAKDSLSLEVSLGFLLIPLKPAIEREINAQLDSLLADKPAEKPDKAKPAKPGKAAKSARR
ncbi:MAG TPA: polyhydroxyalkanoic acid system family protein [Casimicrobiaceae bacterium]|nr:polyhydroxyalkanoic acid system family protein [Casimicrobiaceae bacterium]